MSWGGRTPGRRRAWLLAPATVIAVATVVTLALALAQKSPCLQTHRDPTSHTLQLNWDNNRQYRDACYSDAIVLYAGEHLDQPGAFPYKVSWVDSPGTPSQQVRYMEYPVLTGLLMWAAAKVAQHSTSLAHSVGVLPTSVTVLAFFDVLALVAVGSWLLTVASVRRMTGRRRWDALLAAASPIVIMQAFTNFDAFAVAFAVTGMLAWSRRRHRLAGVLLGLGTAAKLYPVLLLLPLLALCLRAGKLREWRTTALAAAAAWIVVNAPIGLLLPGGWYEFFRNNTRRGANPESLYNIVSQYTGWGGFDGQLPPNHAPSVLNAFVGLALIACVAAIALLALAAPRRPRFGQLAFLVVAAFLLTNKVWSPQYSLWLVPLAVLALPRWKLLLPWMVIDAWQWIACMRFYLPAANGGWGQDPFLVSVIVRDLVVAALCARVVYEIYRPDRDLVRRAGDDDPTGGVLERAGDVGRLRWGLRSSPAVPMPVRHAGVAPVVSSA